MTKKTLAVALALLAFWCMSGPVRAQSIRMATTTSTANTGLLDYLLPKFRSSTGINVQYVAVGTGAALKIGEQGDADVLLVHDRESEDKFMAAGFGVDRRDVMYNDFIIVGVPADPAKIRGMRDAAAALLKIRAVGAAFVSRGDRSGTHMRELQLWRDARVEPKWEGYYLSIGQGMGTALIMTYEKHGYTLTDRGTYLAYEGKTDLQIMVEGDSRLNNPYGVIAVNPARHPRINHAGALKLIQWLTGPEGQKAIADYKVHGHQLFFPSAK